MIGVTENFRKIQDLLAQAAADAGRSPDTIKLLAVSKTKPPEAILAAAAAGQRAFGENFVAEGVEKIHSLARPDLEWHFIGALQSNKTRAAASSFAWIHSIDRHRIALRLSEQRPDDLPELNVCLQVNVDQEAGKSGVTFAELESLADAVAELPRLRLRALMCVPAVRTSFVEQRQPFAALRQAFEKLRDKGHDLDTLSMGMSADFRAAIIEGATIVRIGTALFGPRT